MDDRPADAVTDRRVALHESTEHLRAVLETAVDGIILIDARGTIRIFNPACEKLFGYRQIEVIGRNVKMLMPAPFHGEHDRYLDDYRSTGERKIIGIGRDVEGRRKDGTTFPMALSVGESNHRGEPLFVGIIHDITEQNEFKEALKEAAEQLKAVVDTAVDGVILIDARGTVRMFNPACEKLFGYRQDEVIGRNVKMLMPPPFHEEHDRYLDDYRRTGARKIIGIGRDVKGRRKDDTTFPMALSVGEANHHGEPLFVGIIRDITEQDQFEQALKQGADLLKVVVDTAVDGVILVDSHGIVRMFNPACEQVFGYRQDEVVGHNVKMLMPSPFQEEHDGHMDKYRRSGERKIIGIGREVEGRHRDGTAFPMELSVGEARHKNEPMFVGVVRDITARRHAEDQREQLLKKLADSDVERGHFAHVAAHDLGQSVRMISSFCGLLSANYGDRLDERGREYLKLMSGGATTMRALLDDLVEHGRLDFEEENEAWFDPDSSLKDVLGSLSEVIETSNAVVTHDELPMICATPIRFARLLQNLIGNAIKYVAPGVSPRIHISAKATPGEWIFSVKDNGIGIAPQYHDRIFEPFKRLHNSSQYAGTGMGLAICKKIVQGFGGRLTVESVPQQGATFSFSIKRVPEGT
jgi:two-component system sensor histidine kinase EvgS